MRNNLQNSRGMTLVELLVAMVIFPVVLAVSYAAYLSMIETQRVQGQMVEMQRNARTAMHAILQDIRQAGYGLTELPDIPIYQYNGSTSVQVSLYPLRSPAKERTSTIDMTGMVLTSAKLPNTDTIELFFNSSATQNQPQVTVTGTNAVNSSNTKVSNVSQFKEGDFIVIYDYGPPSQAIMYQITNINVNNELMVHSPGGSSVNPPGGSTLDVLTANWTGNSKVINTNLTDANWIAYYIDTQYNLKRVVKKWDGSNWAYSEKIVASGIEDLQFEIRFRNGVSRSDTVEPIGTPPVADANYDPSMARHVSVSILARTPKPDPRFSDTTVYQLRYGLPHSGGGGYRRMVLTSTAALRNLAAKSYNGQ